MVESVLPDVMYRDSKKWSDLSVTHVAFLKSLIVGNLKQVELSTDTLIREALTYLREICDAESLEPGATTPVYARLFIDAVYSVGGMALDHKTRQKCGSVGKEHLAWHLELYIQHCELIRQGQTECHGLVCEYALDFMIDLVKILKREATIFSQQKAWQIAHAAIDHAVGPDLNSLLKSKKDVAMALSNVKFESMLFHLTKVYDISFRRFADFVEDEEERAQIADAVSKVEPHPPSPGIFRHMSLFLPDAVSKA